MIVKDVDKDGKNDVLVGAGHDFGLYWWKQMLRNRMEAFNRNETDRQKYSQPHALALADLDGDGVDELITGKRYYAHNGGDPGGKELPEIHPTAGPTENSACHH